MYRWALRLQVLWLTFFSAGNTKRRQFPVPQAWMISTVSILKLLERQMYIHSHIAEAQLVYSVFLAPYIYTRTKHWKIRPTANYCPPSTCGAYFRKRQYTKSNITARRQNDRRNVINVSFRTLLHKLNEEPWKTNLKRARWENNTFQLLI